MNMTAFSDMAPFSLVEVDLRFRGAYCLHHEGDVSELRTASVIALIKESVIISETSIYLNETTQRCIPEFCYLKSEM
jgi:hypothetical protein